MPKKHKKFQCNETTRIFPQNSTLAKSLHNFFFSNFFPNSQTREEYNFPTHKSIYPNWADQCVFNPFQFRTKRNSQMMKIKIKKSITLMLIKVNDGFLSQTMILFFLFIKSFEQNKKKHLKFSLWSNHVQSVSKHVFSVRVLWHQNVQVFLFFRQFNCCCWVLFLPIWFKFYILLLLTPTKPGQTK